MVDPMSLSFTERVPVPSMPNRFLFGLYLDSGRLKVKSNRKLFGVRERRHVKLRSPNGTRVYNLSKVWIRWQFTSLHHFTQGTSCFT